MTDWVTETLAYYERLTVSDERWDGSKWVPVQKEESPDPPPDEPSTERL
jgi:hypothetical protein